MFFAQPAQILTLLRSSRMINIGGRPVIVPEPHQPAPGHDRGLAIKLALAFVAIYVIWGSTYLAIRYAVETIPPLVTAGIRHSIAGGIMLSWAWWRGFRPTRQQWVAGFALGALFFLIGHGSLHWAEQYVGSGLAAGDDSALARAMDVARRLEQRVDTLERLLDEDAPGWRARARA